MSWSDAVFIYCERGQDAHFMGEPLNAFTNLAFIIAAFLGFKALQNKPPEHRFISLYLLTTLVFSIGIGSFLFHTFANKWSELADVLPITLFMLFYLGFAMRKFLKLHWVGLAAGFALFFAAAYGAGVIKCDGGPCLNGTIGYAPAWAALLIIGTMLILKKHAAGWYILSAGLVFTLSATFRSIDFMVCDSVKVGSYEIGTHFMWHLLNAVVLYLLLRAAIFYGYQQEGSVKAS